MGDWMEYGQWISFISIIDLKLHQGKLAKAETERDPYSMAGRGTLVQAHVNAVIVKFTRIII